MDECDSISRETRNDMLDALGEVATMLGLMQELSLSRGDEVEWARFVTRLSALRRLLKSDRGGDDIVAEIETFSAEYDAFVARVLPLLH